MITARDRNTAVRWLAEQHFESDPSLRHVFYFVTPTDAPDAPVRVLEVTNATPASGSLEPFGFAATDEFPYRSEIAEVTEAEYASFRSDPSKLPPGWDLQFAVEIPRPYKS